MREFMAVVLITVALIAALVWAFDTPVVFVDIEGVTCGCVVDGDYPTIAQCKQVGKRYEQVTVRSCE